MILATHGVLTVCVVVPMVVFWIVVFWAADHFTEDKKGHDTMDGY